MGARASCSPLFLCTHLCTWHALRLTLCPPASRTEGILGAREVKTGIVFSKDLNRGEDMPRGLESGTRAGQALASAVQEARLCLLAQQYLWGRRRELGRVILVSHSEKRHSFLNESQVFS